MKRVNIKKENFFDNITFAIIAACIFQNFFLSIANRHLFPMNSSIVTLVQLIITAMAAGVVIIRRPRLNTGFFVSLAIVIIISFIGSIYRGSINVKFIYDIILIPIFIALGSSIYVFRAKIIYIIFAIVVAIGLFEGFFVNTYVEIVDQGNYYANTRDWAADSAGKDGEAALYGGAIRPDAAAISGFLGFHRIGSVFLEPHTFSYFSVVMMIYSLMRYNDSTLKKFGLLFIFSIPPILADSRASMFVIIIIFLSWPILKKIPSMISPIILYIYLNIIYFFPRDFSFLFGDVGLRITITKYGLNVYDTINYIIGGSHIFSGDSGVIYMMSDFGAFGLVIYLITISGFTISRNNQFCYAILIFLMFMNIFGAVTFSIKIAAFLGLLIGAVSANRMDWQVKLPEERAKPPKRPLSYQVQRQ